jgi:CheY-like chemotaxis protein
MKKTILLADDDKAFLDAMALRCKSLGPRVDTACDGAQVLLQVSQNPPDLLILDINMPSGNGLDVAARLLQDPQIPPVPVVFCTGRSDQETIDRCKDLGAQYVVKDGDIWGNLRPVICRILGIVTDSVGAAGAAKAAASPSPVPYQRPRLPRLLFVDDDADLRRAMQIRLRACEVDVAAAANAMQALWMAVNEAPDMIVTDYWMPAGSG